MKNKIYYFGWIGSLLTVLGGLFKIIHWPLAGILLTLGLVSLTFLFYPAALRSNYAGLGKKNTSLYVAIFITIFLETLGALFTIQHWPYGNKLVIAGILAPIVIFMPVYLYYHIKSDSQSLTNFFSILFLLAFISVMDSLLSVRISKNIVDTSFQTITATDISDYSTVKRAICYKQLLSDSIHNEEVLTLKQQSEALSSVITNIENEIITMADGNAHLVAFDKYQTIKMKDETQIPGDVIFFNDKGIDSELINKMEAFRQTVLQHFKPQSDAAIYISGLIPESNPNDRSWPQRWFKGCPVALALQELNNLQKNISLAELEALSTLCEKEMEDSVKSVVKQ
ncbi:MAG TPA: hypothetical protein VHO72_17365 [Bacteroidales bacterium]|nr:hypothetical protein [Bacteroidales bacterium]